MNPHEPVTESTPDSGPAVQAKLREAEKYVPSPELIKAMKDCQASSPPRGGKLPTLPPGVPLKSGSTFVFVSPACGNVFGLPR